MNTTFNLWVNNKPRAKDGAFDIFIRVTQDRRHKSLKTGIAVNNLSDFNPKARPGHWVRGRAGAVKKLNDDLEAQLEAIRSHYRKLQRKKQSPSKEIIVHAYKGTGSPDYLAFLDTIIRRFHESGGYRSAKRYNQLLNKLTDFTKARHLPFDQITVSFLKDFQASLKGLHKNTVYEHFKNLKASFNQAIDEDLISLDDSPFRKFKIDRVQTNKEKLSAEEIRRLKELELDPGSGEWHTLNSFLFSFYCGGIRAGDLISLKWSNIDEEGNLNYVMAKTRNSKLIRKTVPLIPEAAEILSYYEAGSPRPSDFIFGMLDNSLSRYIDEDNKIKAGHEVTVYNKIASRNTILNKNLKKIAELAAIEKPLTFHIARHSFAQYALDRDINPKMLQSILGHEKFATTETYIRALSSKKVEEALIKVFQN